MFSSFAFALFLASAALAQDSSATCSSFLSGLNQDAVLNKCLSSLITATADYQTANATSTPSNTKLTSTLDKLCASSIDDSCPKAGIRGVLLGFYSACSDQLTTKLKDNPDVLAAYDKLYILPTRMAACSKDDSGNYCFAATKLPAGQTPAQMQQTLGLSTNTPNIDAFGKYNAAFNFIDGSAPASDLCTPCTRNVINAHLTNEEGVPNAPGIANSPLLKGQIDLYKNVQEKCGPTFLNAGGVQAAGGLSGNNPLSGGAVQIVASASQALFVAGMGIASLIALSVF